VVSPVIMGMAILFGSFCLPTKLESSRGRLLGERPGVRGAGSASAGPTARGRRGLPADTTLLASLGEVGGHGVSVFVALADLVGRVGRVDKR